MIPPRLPKPKPAPPVRQPPLQPGSGVRLTASALGFSYNLTLPTVSFAHPFAGTLGGSTLRLRRGLVETLEPAIGQRPISDPAAVLKLDGKVATEDGESWACLEVEVDDATGLIKADTVPQIVHTAEPRSLDKLLGRCPLVLIVWQRGAPLLVVDVVYFNLRYQRVLPPAGEGAVRHLFF